MKHHNTYLLPYHCSSISYTNNIICGGFIYPLWNTLERVLLSSSTELRYNYIKNKHYDIEIESNDLKKYSILGRDKLYKDTVIISDTLLKPNTILLFPLDSIIARTLIENKLM